VNLDGALGRVTSDRTDVFGWTSVTGWNRDGRIYHAKASNERGRFQVEELSRAGTVVRSVAEGTVPLGMDVIGTYGPTAAAPASIVFFGGGFVQVRALNADGSIGGETNRTALIDEVPIDETSFGPTQATLYDTDGPGAKLPNVIAYDEETGQYRVRALAANGTVGAEVSRGAMATGYTAVAASTGPVGAVLLFVNGATGAMEVRDARNDAPGFPSSAVQAVGAGQTARGYTATAGWTSIAVTGGEFGLQALFHNERTGASARYRLLGNGTVDTLIDTPAWTPGWTAVAPVLIPNCCYVLSAVRE
jgi:hypothetical protein